MSHPVHVQFNLIMLEAEYSDGTHILRRYLLDGTAFPFSDSAFTATIYTGSDDAVCGLSVDEMTGMVMADIPTPNGIVTRQSKKLGDPGSWQTVGS